MRYPGDNVMLVNVSSVTDAVRREYPDRAKGYTVEQRFIQIANVLKATPDILFYGKSDENFSFQVAVMSVFAFFEPESEEYERLVTTVKVLEALSLPRPFDIDLLPKIYPLVHLWRIHYHGEKVL